MKKLNITNSDIGDYVRICLLVVFMISNITILLQVLTK